MLAGQEDATATPGEIWEIKYEAETEANIDA